MKILTESGLSRLWAIINNKFDGINSNLININDQIENIEPAAAIPEDTVNSIIGEVTTSAEAISV